MSKIATAKQKKFLPLTLAYAGRGKKNPVLQDQAIGICKVGKNDQVRTTRSEQGTPLFSALDLITVFGIKAAHVKTVIAAAPESATHVVMVDNEAGKAVKTQFVSPQIVTSLAVHAVSVGSESEFARSWSALALSGQRVALNEAFVFIGLVLAPSAEDESGEE